jgi:ATP-dependent DNA ligase
VVLCAFDLLEFNCRDLRRWPIEDRKRTLRTLLKGSVHGVVYNENHEADGAKQGAAQNQQPGGAGGAAGG